MLPSVKNPYVFLAFPYVSSCRAKDILSFFSADSAYGDALSIFIDLCTVDHSILYTKGAFCVCTFERPLAICVPHGSMTFPLCHSACLPFPLIGQKSSLLVVSSKYIG